jgi:DNA-binding NtrC family response regulator
MKKRQIILIVDDDDQVLDIAAIVLASLGHQVIPATNGEAALEIIKYYRSYYRSVDLLLTDIVMPGAIDGWELARRAKQLQPDLSVLYTTGYGDRMMSDESKPGLGPLLPKPWRADQLASLVSRALR